MGTIADELSEQRRQVRRVLNEALFVQKCAKKLYEKAGSNKGQKGDWKKPGFSNFTITEFEDSSTKGGAISMDYTPQSLDKSLVFAAQRPHTVVDTRKTMENLINRGHLAPDGQVFPVDFVRSAQWFRLGNEHIQNYDHGSLKHWASFLKGVFEEHRNNGSSDPFNGAKSFFAWIDTKGPKLLASPRTSPRFNATWTTHALMRLPIAAELR